LRGDEELSLLVDRAPQQCPYSLDQITGADGEDWFPQPQ
jgi:hypothetical protein